jgi:hypothetical protein
MLYNEFSRTLLISQGVMYAATIQRVEQNTSYTQNGKVIPTIKSLHIYVEYSIYVSTQCE